MIRNKKHLEKYLCVTHHNQRFAENVTTLEIYLTNVTPPIAELRLLLSRLVHLDTIIIELSRLSSSMCARIFKGILFPNLSFFVTSTLPHRGLHHLLENNPTIQSLSVGNCGPTGCDINLKHDLLDISGPTKCVASILRGNTVNTVSATYRTEGETHINLFIALGPSFAKITQLNLHFSVRHNADILRSIAKAAPFVSWLQLTERSFGCQVCTYDLRWCA